MILLFISELNTYLTPDVIEELFVDTTREPKLEINLNITVPAISCKCKLGKNLIPFPKYKFVNENIIFF